MTFVKIPDIITKCSSRDAQNAPVAELADALDLGSSVPDVKVQVLSGAPKKYRHCEAVSIFFCIKSEGLEPKVGKLIFLTLFPKIKYGFFVLILIHKITPSVAGTGYD